MINALPATLAARIITGVIMMIAAFSLFKSSPADAHDLLKIQSSVLLVVNALIFALTQNIVFAGAHRAIFARYWWFPLLDGEWEGEILSNFPRVEAMLLAAQGKRPTFDTLSQELPQGSEQPIPVTATIRSSLFEIAITLAIPGTDRTSQTLFVRPQWKRPNAPRLIYMYRQTDRGRVAVTDTNEHFGAAILDYNGDRDDLSGEYWTQRQANKGLNTAGRLVLRRIKAG